MQELMTTSVAYLVREAHIIALIASVLLTCALTYMLFRTLTTVKPVPITIEHVEVPMTEEERHLYLRLAISDVLSEGFEEAVRKRILTRDEANQYARRVFKALGVSEHIPSHFRISPSVARNTTEDKAKLAELRARKKERQPSKFLLFFRRKQVA